MRLRGNVLRPRLSESNRRPTHRWWSRSPSCSSQRWLWGRGLRQSRAATPTNNQCCQQCCIYIYMTVASMTIVRMKRVFVDKNTQCQKQCHACISMYIRAEWKRSKSEMLKVLGRLWTTSPPWYQNSFRNHNKLPEHFGLWCFSLRPSMQGITYISGQQPARCKITYHYQTTSMKYSSLTDYSPFPFLDRAENTEP